MPVMKSFVTRSISAIVALGIIALLWNYFHVNGLKALVVFAVIIGSFEIMQMIFKNNTPTTVKSLFFILSVSIFGFSSAFFAFGGIIIPVALALFWVICVLMNTHFKDIQDLRDKIALGSMGLIYVGALPVFVWQLLEQINGVGLFASLLAIVFAGDIGAYLCGVLWGKSKMMPKLSPKKSWQGSIGGMVFSVIAAVLCSRYLLDTDPYLMAALGLVSAVFAQLGDFFESLLKRVADIKDSGKIMPGHGGVLDRIDGVLMAAPIFYLGLLLINIFVKNSQF